MAELTAKIIAVLSIITDLDLKTDRVCLYIFSLCHM